MMRSDEISVLQEASLTTASISLTRGSNDHNMKSERDIELRGRYWESVIKMI